MSHQEMPRSIQQDICVEQIGPETLVYNERSHKAFCLNATSSAVWRKCDGAHTIEQIAAAVTFELATPVSEELVQYALGELRRDGLLEASPVSTVAPGISRRDMMQKLGFRAALLLPVVAMVTAPKAAHATSGCVDCVPPDDSNQPESTDKSEPIDQSDSTDRSDSTNSPDPASKRR
jgi:hypothetical protein